MDKPLYIAFLWHMHQPYYKDPLTGEVTMPWVRLHAIKDYLDMVQILEDFPSVHMTFNLVPSLLDQLNDYIKSNGIKDRFMELTLKPASAMTQEEKVFILLNFFMANWDTMIRPHPRYYDLLMKRGKYASPAEAAQVVKRFSDDDIRDLQVWFNLAWFDPYFRQHIPQLKELAQKGAYFDEEDKKAIFDIQLEIIKTVLPKYKSMQDAGQIEISTTPYYHPILPLVCDTDVAKVSAPWIKLPRKFSHPEDAFWHVKAAIEYYKEFFGSEPKGFWPSEGSVSEEAVKIFMDLGVKWIATDEDILCNSIGRQRSGDVLYKPYLLKRNGKELSIFFRDHGLSDAIGFVYGNMHYKDAVNDFMKHLHETRRHLKDKGKSHLISIILDGENAWEYYSNDGRDFLTLLHETLNKDPDIKAVTFSEYLDKHPAEAEIESLYPGSWIYANFAVWIGHEEKNTAWDYLNDARTALVAYEESNPNERGSEKLLKAWREVYVAEGSDWNWWYGEDHYSSNADEFDKIYRNHLTNIYRLIDKEPPDYLGKPIRIRKVSPMYEPTAYISPRIDGRQTDYYEWLAAGYLDVAKSGGTMHQSQGIIRHLYYGFDRENIYVRVDLERPEERKGMKLLLNFSDNFRIELSLDPAEERLSGVVYKKQDDGNWADAGAIEEAALDKILELKIPQDKLGLLPGEEFSILLNVERNGILTETIPARGPMTVKVPPKDFEAYIWSA